MDGIGNSEMVSSENAPIEFRIQVFAQSLRGAKKRKEGQYTIAVCLLKYSMLTHATTLKYTIQYQVGHHSRICGW